jgi:transcriptional regulator with XRE-family HTH domain
MQRAVGNRQPVADEARRRELAEFLRSRRQRLTPAAVGLPSGARRRTPGLRREEVAELAGIGTAWYTWLEQARDIRPSEGALWRIAKALRLDRTERHYLMDLALERAPETHVEEIVPPAVLSLLHTLTEPALVKGRCWDLLAFNEVANALFDFEHARERNLLKSLFTPESRAMLPNWEACARQNVAIFRADTAGILRDPDIARLVDEMKAKSSQFREWWSEQTVAETKSGHKTYRHPKLGRMEFEFTILEVADNPNLRFVVYIADDEQTRARVSELVRAKDQGMRHTW